MSSYATIEPQITLLHRVSSIVSSELSLDEMLGEIIGLTVQATECDACLVYLIESGTGEIVLRASQVPHAAELGTLRMKMGEGVTGWVAEHKSVVALAASAAADHNKALDRCKSQPEVVRTQCEQEANAAFAEAQNQLQDLRGNTQ